MKSLLTIVGFALVLLVISVFSKIIGGVAGEHLAKKELAKEEAASRASFQAKLDEVSRGLNAHLPKMVDKDTRLDTTRTGPEPSLSYIHSFPKKSSKKLDFASLREVLTQNAKSKVCGSSEALTMLKGGITIHFIYNTNDGIEIARSSFGAADCGA